MMIKDIIMSHEVAMWAAEKPENQDLAGRFHITSTWKKSDNWKLIFNMDSRIYG